MSQHEEKINQILEVINFAIEDDEPRAFLKAWREGDWDTLHKEWPAFSLEYWNKHPSTRRGKS